MKGFKNNSVDYESIFLIANGLNLYIKSGISTRKALELVKVTIKSKIYLNAIERIEKSIEVGNGIGEAFSKERKLFTNDFVDMIIMAEESGKLEEVLAILAKHFEKNNKMRKEIRKNLAYPILLIGTMLLVFLLIIIFIIPTLADMYKDMESELSIFTKIMLNINEFMEMVNPITLLISIILIGLFIIFLLKELLKEKDLFGNLELVKNYREIKLVLILNMIIQGGIAITSAIRKLKDSVNDRYLKGALNDISKGLYSGLSLTESIKETRVISKLSESLLLTGEESGNLDESIEKLSEILEYQFNTKVNRAVFYIEPVAILFLGGLVLVLILMVFTPMYEYMNYV